MDQNATKAALRAGYAATSAHSQAHDLLKKPEIKEAIEKGLAAQAKKIEARVDKEVVFTKAMWLRELKLIAMSNMDDFVTIDEVELYKDVKDKKPVMQITANATPTNKRRSKLLGKVIRKISETKNGIGIELHGKQAALDTLGRHYGWVKDGVEIDDKNKPKVVITLPSNGREAPKEIPLPVKEESSDDGND